jgi:hypothetical protein
MAYAAPDLRFVRAHPQQLRQGEVGQRGIRRELEEARRPDLLVEPAALLRRALIAPDDRRPQDTPRVVEQHRAVHLSGQADGADRLRRGAALRQDRPDRLLRRAPPVFRILLGPCRTGRSEGGVLGGRRRDQPPVFAEQERARASGADIDSQ